MSADEKWIKAVAKLIELSQTDALKWERSTNTNRIFQDDDYCVDVVFFAKFESHNLRLYRARKRVVPVKQLPTPYGYGATGAYTITTAYSGAALFPEPTEPYWTSDTVLEIIDDSKITMYKFPSISAIQDLYNCVIAKTSRVDDLVEKLTGPNK